MKVGRYVDFSAPTPYAIAGAGNLPATNEMPVDMYSKTFTAFPSLTPLLVMLSKLAEDTAWNFRVDWTEENQIPTKVICATTESTASTSISVVAEGKTLVAGTLLYNPRVGDLRSVTGNPTSNSLTVVISKGGTTSAAWEAGDVLYVLPPALAENDNYLFGQSSTDALMRPSTVVNSNVYNYLQTTKLQFGISRTLADLKSYSGRTFLEDVRSKKYREFRIKSEHQLWFGGRATSGSAPAEVRMMGGLVYFLKNGTLYKDFGGFMTESGFRNMMGDYKDQNPDSTAVTMFAAGNVVDIMDGWGIGKLTTKTTETQLGFDINQYKSRGMMIDIVTLPLFTDPTCRGWFFILDMERIRLKYHPTGKPMYHPEALNVGQSEIIYGTYRSSLSMILGSESKHAMGVGATL